MKKIILILALVMASGFYQTNQAKSKQTDKNSGENIFMKQADKSLALIEQAAQKISIKGVAVIAFIPGDVTVSWNSKMKVVGNLTSGKSNLLGIAYTKASEMADTHRDSGSKIREIYSGELGYQGGLIKKVNSGYILAVFSGGSGEQDLEVAKIGLDWLAKFYK
jgi:hypothetical protein